MFLRPFENQGEGSPGHLTFQDVQGSDADQYFVLGVKRMEVRWSVVAQNI